MARVTLTFDNGPSDAVTPGVLDALRSAEAPATFFVVGSRLSRSGWRHVRRAVAEGHRIGNHTWSHSGPLGEMSDAAAIDEIRRTEEQLRPITGDLLFRPVGGGEGGIIDRRLLRRSSADYLVRHGYTLVLWNVVPRDWVDPAGWVRTAVEQCARQEHSCVVLHDIPEAAGRELPVFLGHLRDAGITIVPEFPADCTPIVGGRVTDGLDSIVSDWAQSDAAGRASGAVG